MTGSLTECWRRDGYLICPGLLNETEVASLNADAGRVCREQRGDAAPQDDEVATRGALAIHFPHKLSPLMRESMRHPRIVEILTHVIGPNVKSMQSMLFFKYAGKPGQAWHQDESFIPTRDRSLTGGWIALDDATIDNGCLLFLPSFTCTYSWASVAMISVLPRPLV